VALYATTPVSEGGLGLSRICVIDIDVHHGNGTQDILCSTYDPRFLYVSIHAGGPHVNGIDLGEIGDELGHHLGRNPKKGIFPGRCGDTSPHEGVLNIPLGPRVTSHALGTALITKVSPAVEKFAPDLIIVSAGFDAHKNDPLNLGGLSAEDFGTLTEIICKLAFKSCSGRVLSVLEGGYGVPCCRPQHFPPAKEVAESDESKAGESKRPPKEESRAVVANAMTSQSLEEGLKNSTAQAATNPETNTSTTPTSSADHPMLALQEQIVPLQCLDLGEDLPPDMPDIISSYVIQKRLDRCHSEGFVQCVQEHVTALARCNVPTNF
jgi:acetoin utilization deacetylase AcuC-like enzyme